jgi:Lipoprotein confined to pathogenic Mycobacterium
MTTTRALAALLAVAALVIAGCNGGGGGTSGSDKPDSPITNEDLPAMDIANLPDIEATRTQMLDLIERVRGEVARLVPASAPWEWKREESRAGCERNGRQGVTLYFASLTSPHSFTDEEWNVALPAVQRMAAEAGLTSNTAMQDSARAHDVRFTSDDGRELLFGSIEASLITGTIVCRLSPGEETP